MPTQPEKNTAKWSKIRDHMTSLTIQRDHNYWRRTSCTLWMQNHARYGPLFHPCWGQGEEWKSRQDVLGHVLSNMFRDHHQLTPSNEHQPTNQISSHEATQPSASGASLPGWTAGFTCQGGSSATTWCLEVLINHPPNNWGIGNNFVQLIVKRIFMCN